MKLKNLFLFMALFTAMMLKADPGNGNTIPLRPIKTTPNNSGRPRTPVCVPTIYLDGHTLFFETSCDGCTLQLFDEDGNVVYSLVIPTGTTSLTLPATLTGNYEIQIIRGDFTFVGEIEL